ncbi:MAG: HAD family hydrolase [Candidatus Brocadiia bacterium]
MADPQAPLRDFEPAHDFIVAIDSDGCAFNTMEVKHKACFYPMVVRHWGLAGIAKQTRDVWDFVNLYSTTRGCNRFHALIHTLDFVREMESVRESEVEVPQAAGVREWKERETKLGNPALKAEVGKNPDPDLKRALGWSLDINKQVEKTVKNVPPFPLVRDSLEKITPRADAIVVSATPNEALKREWEEHDIAQYVEVIAGQERGSKAEHLSLAAEPNYPSDHILMVGDSPGDMKSAKSVDALFFPIFPGEEEHSWEIFYNEALDKFFAGEYAGSYEQELIDEYNQHLPETPPWKE